MRNFSHIVFLKFIIDFTFAFIIASLDIINSSKFIFIYAFLYLAWESIFNFPIFFHSLPLNIEVIMINYFN